MSTSPESRIRDTSAAGTQEPLGKTATDIAGSDALEPVPILLVEDSAADIVLTREALIAARLANRLDVLTDGEMALDYLNHEPPFEHAPRPGLVLLDLNLPRLDGMKVLKAMKTDPALQHRRGGPHHLLRSLGRRVLLPAPRQQLHHQPVKFQHFVRAVQGLQGFWFELVRLPSRKVDPPSP